MAGTGDPSEDTPTVTLVDAANVARTWRQTGKQLDSIGHQVAAMKATGANFPEKVTTAMFGIGQGCTSVAAQWTTAAGDVQKQHDSVDTPKAADYKTKTAEVQTAKKATAQGLMIAAMGGSPSYAESAAANLAAKRAERQSVLDTAVSDTKTHVQPLPGHARLAGEAVTTARGTMVTNSGGQSMPDDVQQIVPPKAAPTGNPSGGPNAKPTSNTPSSPSKPTDTKPTANKNQTDAPSDTKGQSPQSQLPQSPGQQQGQGQGQQPQQGGAAQPGGAATTGAGAQRAPGALPVSQPTPVKDSGGKGGGPTVRPTPSSPVQTPAQRAGLGNVGKGGGTLGSGTAATGAGGAASPTANKSGSVGAATGGSSSASTGAGRAPMGGGMMGGGHGAGAGGAQARPKAEVKTTDKRMSAEDIAEQALGGVVKDGDDGRPVLPAAPGSNGKAPTPPSPPVKP